MINRSILQDVLRIHNVHASNNRVPRYMWQKPIELHGEIDEFTIIAGDFNIPVSEMDRSSKQKISKNMKVN